MKRIATVLAALALATVVMAQGSTSNGSSSNGSVGTSSYSNVSSIQPPTFSAATTTPDTILVHWALVKGEWRPVLTTSQGMTLYFDDQDTSSKATCTGACATAFKPYDLPKNVPGPTGGGNLTYVNLSTISGPSGGKMLEVEGHPVYTFVKDQRQGEALGSQVKNPHWHVATPALDRFQ